MSDKDLIDEAIRSGKLHKIEPGVRAISEKQPKKHALIQRPEACGRGRTVPKRPTLSSLDGDFE